MDEAQESSPTTERYTPSSKMGRRAPLKADEPGARVADRSVTQHFDRTTGKYVTITIDADSAQVIRVDGFGATGLLHELSGDERTTLANTSSGDTLAKIVEQAFEAGIACVLGDDDSTTTAESAEEAELRHRLLAPLIARSAVGPLMERGALNRAVLNTLIAGETT
jgi:hypothetical protein